MKSFLPFVVSSAVLVLTIHLPGDTTFAGAADGLFPVTLSNQPGGATRIQWAANGASYDVVRGDLRILRDTNGDFALATGPCRFNDVVGSSIDDADIPESGAGFWYLVRYDQSTGFPEWGAQSNNEDPPQRGRQFVNRDTGIEASTQDCACYYFCCYDHPGQCFFPPWP